MVADELDRQGGRQRLDVHLAPQPSRCQLRQEREQERLEPRVLGGVAVAERDAVRVDAHPFHNNPAEEAFVEQDAEVVGRVPQDAPRRAARGEDLDLAPALPPFPAAPLLPGHDPRRRPR